MDFLKALFKDGEALTYDQLAAKVTEAKLKVVDISGGAYLSKEKHDNKVGALNQQITDLQGQVTQRDNDLADLNVKLTAAQADAGKLSEAQAALTALQAKYDTDKQEFDARIAAQSYEYAVRERANALHFSSASAKKAFIQDAIEKQFKQDGDNLTGYDDFLSEYKAADPGAFAPDPAADPASATPPAGAPTITLPTGGAKPGKRMSLTEIMQAKNANPDMAIDFGQ